MSGEKLSASTAAGADKGAVMSDYVFTSQLQLFVDVDIFKGITSLKNKKTL